MKYLVLLGRVLYSLIFIKSSVGHFSSSTVAMIASKGVPLASIAAPLSGILAFAGGLSILLGYKARWGAWLLVLFLIPVTLIMHNYWTIPDPMMRMMQQVMFLKNLSMLGAALLIAYFGSGPLSLDKESHKEPVKATRPAYSEVETR